METNTQNKSYKIALLGSPNSGKTTLFNTLTGSRQKTGNYPGVTVERKEGFVSHWGMSLLDLPGLYSLNAKSPDEEVSSAIVSGSHSHETKPDLVIAVADATNLERQLYLVTELRELNIPIVLAITMTDLLSQNGLKIDAKELQARLGIPVVLVCSLTKEGFKELHEKIERTLANWTPKKEERLPQAKEFIEARYKFIDDVIKNSIQKTTTQESYTKKIDRIVLHKIYGPALLFLLFTLMFQLIFSMAEIPMNLIEEGFGGLGTLVKAHISEGPLRDLLVDGVIAGVGSVVIFLPQILILFSFIILFEDSGYMARAAFILDRIMSKFGLNGRAFIPLLSSFACAVPGIMATRSIPSKKERFITILISPLMACSARIPVYTMLVSAFIPNITIAGFLGLQGLVLFSVYFSAVIVAMFISLIFGKTLFKGGATTPFLIELPTYKVPSLKNLSLGLFDRARVFLKKAGTTILAVSIILWALATYPELPEGLPESQQTASQKLEHSYIGRAGKFIEPVVKPLGYDWKLGIGLLTSFAAREVVITTLSTIYSVGSEDDDGAALADKLKAAKDPNTGAPSFTIATAMSMLVFYMLACQCISTLAVTRRETNSWLWPTFMFAYMTILAYGSAYVTYRILSFFNI